jgi:hypothetical protein
VNITFRILAEFIALAAKAKCSLFLDREGGVWGTGFNHYYQITATEEPILYSPVKKVVE